MKISTFGVIYSEMAVKAVPAVTSGGENDNIYAYSI